MLDYLRRRRLLLILDNFDHLIGEADLIAEILATAPAVTLLITSREPLQLRGEYVLLLEGVSVPPDDADGAEHGANPAVRLFVQAAERAQPGYVPSTDDLRAIAAIARLVEGLPLALELAAAWMRLLSPTAILAELQRSLALLHSDLRDAPERQRSIEAVCLAAWQRLSPAARDGFERLSVCEGGFTREAAREVAGLDLPELAVLVSHALVRHDPVTDRFGLHPLPRRFAAARLASDPARLAETRRRHATWHLDILVARARELQTAGQFRALAALRSEEGNVRAAWRHSLTEGMPALIARAAPALGRYYLWQGHTHEGVEAFAAALEATTSWNGAPEQQRLRATLMLWHAVFCHREGQGAAQAAIETGLALLDAAEHAGVEVRPERAFGLWQLARIQASRGDGAATALLRQAVALYRALDLSWELSMVLADLGDHLRDEGSPDEAGEALREAQTIGERASDEHSLARILQRRSQICLETGDPEEAEGLARRACELARRAGGPPDLAAALGWLGVVLMHRHNQGEAELRASLALYAELNEPAPLALAECRLALCLLHRGRLAEGLEHAHRAVAGDAQVGEAIQAQALLALGLGQWAAGDAAAASASLEAGITLCRQHRLTTTLGMLLATLSGVAQDDPRRARAWAREALRIALERRNRLLLALLFTNAAALLLALGRPVRAAEAQALDAAGPFRGASELIAPRRAATLATLRATLDPGTLAAALDRGHALDPWAAAGQLAEELALEE